MGEVAYKKMIFILIYRLRAVTEHLTDASKDEIFPSIFRRVHHGLVAEFIALGYVGLHEVDETISRLWFSKRQRHDGVMTVWPR